MTAAVCSAPVEMYGVTPCTVARTAASWPRPIAKSTVRCMVVRSRGGIVGVVDSTRPLITASCCSFGRSLYSASHFWPSPCDHAHHRFVVVEADGGRCSCARADRSRRTPAATCRPTAARTPAAGSPGADDVERGIGRMRHQLFLPQVARWCAQQLEDRRRRADRDPGRTDRAGRDTASLVSSASTPGVSSASSAAISAEACTCRQSTARPAARPAV